MEIYKQPSEMEMCHLPAISIYGYVANFFLARLVHFSYIFLSSMKIVGTTGLGGLGVAHSRYKLALRSRIRNLNLKSQISICDIFREIRVPTYDFWKFVGVKVGLAPC